MIGAAFIDSPLDPEAEQTSHIMSPDRASAAARAPGFTLDELAAASTRTWLDKLPNA
jgi:hypothetical protein